MVNVAVVVRIEEAQPLLAVGGIRGRVDIQNDLLPSRALRPMTTEPLQPLVLEQSDRFPGRRVLQAREGGLRSQRLTARADHRAQGRVVAQEGGIVGILVARRDLVDALTQQIECRMLDVAGIPLINQQSSQFPREPQALVELTQQDQPCFAGDLATLEVERELGLELEPESGMTLCSHRHPHHRLLMQPSTAHQ